MITVWATECLEGPDTVLHLRQYRIKRGNMEIMDDIGTFTYTGEDPVWYKEGPICAVRMTSGLTLFINATSEELEARSA